ncbi:MAG: glycine--tRNA ligase subunit beta [Rhodanobacteraceae bacterium]
MTDARTLLIELGCEELPPAALDALSSAFLAGICDGLQQAGIDADTDAARAFSTPRRLAVRIPAVAGLQPEQSVERRGPSVQAGLNEDGSAGKALQGFARSCGVEPDALERMATDKGEWFVYRAVQPGKALAELLPGIMASTIKAMPIPRPMRWGDHDYSFVRPVHWLLVLHGDAVIELELMGLASGRQTRGHRFHHPTPVHVADADSWVEALRLACVDVDAESRAKTIHDKCRLIARSEGLDLSMPAAGFDAPLMRELVNITEWPHPILCRFDEAYLELPAPVLTTTMEVDQRFIATYSRSAEAGEGESGAFKLSPWFFGIANIESKDPAIIRQGYERVIRPRFADARFFYEEDLKKPLEDYRADLEQVTYQQSLGSVWDKCARVAELARVIANRVGVDAGQATRAAALCKCDLATRMVGEFPEMQGTMGYYYARQQGEPLDIAQALDHFYRPRQAGDPIADGKLAQVLAVAERLDTLAGIFAVGLKPSGNKDPFALRRAALGLGRTLIEGGLDIDLAATLTEALELIPDQALAAGLNKGKGGKTPTLDAGRRRAALSEAIHEFVLDRLRGYYAEQDFATEQFEAVLAVAPRTLTDFDRRLRAVAEFARLPEAGSLAAANKRVANILRKQDDLAADMSGNVDAALFEHDAERVLAAAVAERGRVSNERCAEGDYTGALKSLAGLQQPVDRFFDEVMVMADDPALRHNRLALLADLHARFMAIADIGQLHA